MNKISLGAYLSIVLTILVSGAFGANLLPRFEQFSLPNGLKIVAWEDHEQPMVYFSLMVKCGPASDSANLSGLAALTSFMLKEGSKKYPGAELAEVIDSVGGMLRSYQDEKDALLFEGNFMSRDLAFGMDILGDMLAHPTFPEDALDRLKRRLIAAILQYRSIPGIFLKDALYHAFYDNQGYGLPNRGRVATINRITIKEVTQFYRDNIRPGNSVLIIAGDFSLMNLRKIVNSSFSGWQNGGKCWNIGGSVTIPDSSKIILIDNPTAPGVDFALGRAIVPASSPDFPSLALLNYILGGGGRISRLFQNLVGNNALATYVSSSLDLSKGNGLIYISGATTRDAIGDAMIQIKATFDDLRNIRIPVRELEGAKYFYRGYFASLYETPQSSVDILSRLLSHGVSLDFHDKLLAEFDRIDVNRLRNIAERYLNYNNYVIVVSGSEAALKNSLLPLGAVEVVKPGQK